MANLSILMVSKVRHVGYEIESKIQSLGGFLLGGDKRTETICLWADFRSFFIEAGACLWSIRPHASFILKNRTEILPQLVRYRQRTSHEINKQDGS